MFHSQIGRLWLRQLTPAQFTAQSIPIVQHLNQGQAFLTDQGERDEAAALNLLACRVARTAAHYAEALGYARAGIDLLGSEGWQRRYSLMLALHIEAAEGASRSGDRASWEEFAVAVLWQTGRRLDAWEELTSGLFARPYLAAALPDIAGVVRASQVLAGELALDTLLPRVVQMVLEAAGAERVVLLLEQHHQWYVAAVAHVGAAPAAMSTMQPAAAAALPRSVLEHVRLTHEEVMLRDVHRAGPFAADPYLAALAAGSLLCVPLLHREALVGMLYLEHRSAASLFSAEGLDLLNLLFHQVTISIENARLYGNLEALVAERTTELVQANRALQADIAERQRIEAALRESEARHQASAREHARLYERERLRVQELNALSATMTEISAELEISRLLYAILERAVELLHASDGELALYDEQRNDLHVLVVYQMPRDYAGTRLAMGEGATGYVAQTRQTLNIENYLDWPGHLPSYDVLGKKSVLLVPLLAGDHLVGVIGIGDVRTRTFSQQDEELLSLLAQQATVAIKNARFYEAARRRAEEAETLRRAGAIVAATLQQDESIARILEQLAYVVPHDCASVQLLSGEDSVIVGGHGFSDLQAVLGMRFSVKANTPTRLIYQERRLSIFNTAAEIDTHLDGRLFDDIQSWMGVPLVVQERVIGMLALESRQSDHFTADHARLVAAFADQVAIALENARLFAEVQQLATLDPLTELSNRRHFFALARTEFERSLRYGHPLSIIMLDVDNFKKINDRYGHAAGDQVLRVIAAQCRDALRSVDIVGRYGGEEMVVMLPETEREGARQVAERLRQSLAQTAVPLDSGMLLITSSLGVATRDPGDDIDLETLIDCADQALYIAKQTGKNRVICWEDGLVTPPSALEDHGGERDDYHLLVHMTAALRFAALHLLAEKNWEHCIQMVLGRFGTASELSCIVIYANRIDRDNNLYMMRCAHWMVPGIVSLPPGDADMPLLVHEIGLERWPRVLSRGDIIAGQVRTFPAEEQGYLLARSVQSTVLVPVFAGLQWWGHLRFDVCDYEHTWSIAELDAFRTLASMLGAAVERQQRQQRARFESADVEATVRVAAYLSQYTSLTTVLEAVCADVARRLAAPVVVLYRYEREPDHLVRAGSVGVPAEVLTSLASLPRTVCARLLRSEQRQIILPDIQAEPDMAHYDLARALDLHGVLSMPLWRAGDLAGMMLAATRATWDEVTTDDPEALGRLADQAALIVTNGHLFGEPPRSADEILEGWSYADDQADQQSVAHTLRVAELTVRLAQVMGVRAPHLVHLRLGALLHGIGRLGIPDAILRKPGPLTAEEWLLVRQQPIYAYEMLASVDFLHAARDIPYCHAERWDGSGYPRGLKGEDIPLAARVFTVVDVWDTLLHDRPGRPAWPSERVQEYLAEQAGKQFDPRIVATFLRMIQGAWSSAPGTLSSSIYADWPHT
jgi:diguanylate cyclase (GGDEF)-like protein